MDDIDEMSIKPTFQPSVSDFATSTDRIRRNKDADCAILGIKPPLFILAPMVRLAFRSLVRKYAVDLTYTPMIYAENFLASELCRANEFTTNDDDWPIVQFAANKPSDFAAVAEIIYGQAKGIDLNCGCPKRDVRSEGYGSKLLESPDVIADIVKQTRAKISDPDFSISVKIRIEYPIEKTVDLCRQVESCGVSHIAVHGRTVSMRNETPDYEAIRLIKSSLNVPVYANGGCNSYDSALKIASITGADGLMVAEGLLSNPALFAGHNKTPVSCIQDWINEAKNSDIQFKTFHRHASFMSNSILNRAQRSVHGACKTISERNARCLMGILLICTCSLVFLFAQVCGMRVRGTWDPGQNKMTIVSRFAVQPVDSLFPQSTLGFVFGNLTNNPNFEDQNTSDLAMFMIPESKIRSFQHNNMWQFDCQNLLKDLSTVLYEPRCMNRGKRSDYMRWIPCKRDQLCKDETSRISVIPGYQFTLRLEEPYVPEYWYLIFVSCYLDDNCTWTETVQANPVDYDVFITNGNPSTSDLSTQFSFEEQNVLEMMLLALAFFVILSILQWKACTKARVHEVPMRMRIVNTIITLECTSLSLLIVNSFKYAYTGSQFETLTFIAVLLRNLSDCALCLILLLLGSGWSLRKPGNRLAENNAVFYMWAVVSMFHIVFFSYGYIFMEDQKNYSDLLMLRTAKALILIRIGQGLWFLIEIKRSLRIEPENSARAAFLTHFGAAYLVWFSYYILLVLVSLVVSEFYRLKFVFSVTTFANFVAIACLVHIFWPVGSYRRFFSSDLMMHRTFSNTSSAGDSEEFDALMTTPLDDDEPDNPFN
ncbi:TRNA-dihydrouridine(20a/20b) synthase [NAD(P)+]-like [Aphelenchoides besseyi]|nr:TRNA-dihydrouridine(20a/20b) synthase [NAD(P)+]-like [Aphelenchoides besseyi]